MTAKTVGRKIEIDQQLPETIQYCSHINKRGHTQTKINFPFYHVFLKQTPHHFPPSHGKCRRALLRCSCREANQHHYLSRSPLSRHHLRVALSYTKEMCGKTHQVIELTSIYIKKHFTIWTTSSNILNFLFQFSLIYKVLSLQLLKKNTQQQLYIQEAC